MNLPRKQSSSFCGFSLTELLIALGILGVIVAFTIPKVLQAQQNQKWNAEAKQVMSMLQSAYMALETEQGVVPSTRVDDITQYLNYVRLDTAGQLFDGAGEHDSKFCENTKPCIRLHSGGLLYYLPSLNFGAGQSNNFIYFIYDPDGVYSGSTNGPGDSLWISIYYDGRVTTGGNKGATDVTCGGSCHVGWGQADPDWYNP